MPRRTQFDHPPRNPREWMEAAERSQQWANEHRQEPPRVPALWARLALVIAVGLLILAFIVVVATALSP